jgi:hypothetical protein
MSVLFWQHTHAYVGILLFGMSWYVAVCRLVCRLTFGIWYVGGMSVMFLQHTHVYVVVLVFGMSRYVGGMSVVCRFVCRFMLCCLFHGYCLQRPAPACSAENISAARCVWSMWYFSISM